MTAGEGDAVLLRSTTYSGVGAVGAVGARAHPTF